MMRTDKQLDQTISKWLEAEAPAQLPDRVLGATFERTLKTKQRRGWRSLLGRVNVGQSLFALGGAAVVVLAAGVALTIYVNNVRVGELPSTPDAWSRVSLETQFATAQVDENSLVVSSRGLLALIGELGGGGFQLAFSSDGYEWVQVPTDQGPSLDGHRVKLIGTDRGFMMFVDSDLWTSADGFEWQRLASAADDPDLRDGGILAAASGGPGLVAVGFDNKAWYSMDGTDWTRADVPPPPSQVFEQAGLPAPTVAMLGVAVAGNALVAWGEAMTSTDEAGMIATVMWTSNDGMSWVNVIDPPMEPPTKVAGGPRGFVATGRFLDTSMDRETNAAWLSADGQNWERASYRFDSLWAGDAARNDEPVSMEAVAAASGGFVAVGTDGLCALCPTSEARIWTSPDGRAWSALPSNGLFSVSEPSDPYRRGARATSVVAWGPRFVVAGHYDGKPVIWISGSEPGQENEQPAPSAAVSTAAPSPTDAAPQSLAPSPTPTPLPTSPPTAVPTTTAAPIVWDSQSTEEDWPAPPRTEPSGAPGASPSPVVTASPVAPGWVQYSDVDADTAPIDVPAVDIHTMQIGDGCAEGEPELTCIELTLSGHVDEPRPLPEDAWYGFGIVVDMDADGAPDQRYGVDNAGRAWRTDLRTGETVTGTGFDEALYAEFPPGVEATGGDTPEAIFHLRESGFRFYGWSSLIANGAVQATDYAPDVGWLVVPDARFVGSWESSDTDGIQQSMEVIALADGTYELTVHADSASACTGAPSTMTGIAAPQEPDSIVIAQPEYSCDDGSDAEAPSGPPLDEQLRNFTLTYDSELDALVDPSGLIWTRVEALP